MKFYKSISVYTLMALMTLSVPGILQAQSSSEDGGRPADIPAPRVKKQEKTSDDAPPDSPGIYGPEEFRYNENYFGLDQVGRKNLMDRLQWQLSIWTSFNYFNNGDLRALNENNETSVDETDDKVYFIVGGAAVDFFLPVNPHLDVRVDIWKTGFWGHDQLGGRDNNNDSTETFSGSNTVNFGKFFLDIHIRPEPTRTSKLDLTIGRQSYEIGGEIYRDFWLDDTLDAVVFKWYSDFGRLDVLLIDVYSSGSPTDDVNFVQYISHDSEKTEGFNGDVHTYRQGLNYSLAILGDEELGGTHFEARGFYYYAKYGGTNDGGSDRTNEGTSGNYPDDDFSFMRGVRLNFGWQDWFRTTLSYAESFGKDRKQLNSLSLPLEDMDNNGRSWGLELEFSFFNRRLIFLPTYFIADGGRYHIDGKQFSHGFVSMKGKHTGGILTNLNWGMHPSAYVDDDGIDDTPFERARKSGSEVQHIGFKIGVLENLFINLDWWRFTDTNSMTMIGQRRKPFGGIFSNDDSYSYFEQQLFLQWAIQQYPQQSTILYASRRFGAPLGQEMNLGVEWDIYVNWKVWATAGVFYPMRYYATPGMIQGTPEGSANFVGFQLGMQVII